MFAVIRLGALAASLTGCQLVFDVTPPDVPTPDAEVFPLCYGQGLVQLCLESQPSDEFLTGVDVVTLDTDSSPSCDAHSITAGAPDGGSLDACVVAARTIRIEGVLHAIGTRPLIFVSPLSIEIETAGLLNAISQSLTVLGPNANFAACQFARQAENRSGGAGGTFGGQGGRGGNADGGLPGAVFEPTFLRGGCRGGGGALPSMLTNGLSGGAVYLIAPEIQIDGTINASGAGGLGGTANDVTGGGGGGGGGSGGMIGLDGTVMLGLNAQVFANGGGGGEGGGTTGKGCRGQDPTSAANAALGGNDSGANCGANGGGNGGNGSALTTLTGDPGLEAEVEPNTGSGGGGGGGAGIILMFPVQDLTGSGTISPPPL